MDDAFSYRLDDYEGLPPRSADVLAAIRDERIGGVLLRGFLPEATCAAVVEALERGALDVTPTRFAREFEAFSYGPCLDQAERDLEGYLARVPGFDRALGGLFGELSIGIEEKVLATLQALAGARPVARPTAHDGSRYALCTIRRLPVGGCIPPHAENEQFLRGPYRELGRALDRSVLISWYLTLRPAQAGGELAVHDLDFRSIDPRSFRDEHSDVAGVLRGHPHRTIAPRAGDLLVFDGGRRFHQVLPVLGDRARWTLGGFCAFASDGVKVFAWG